MRRSDAAEFAAVARLHFDHDATRGSGFLVAPRVMLTALHVVASDRKSDPPVFRPGPWHVTFAGRTESVVATLRPGRYSREDDWALLECNPPPGIDPLPLAAFRDIAPYAAWRSFGYPEAANQRGKICHGHILGAVPDRMVQLFSFEAAAGTGEPVGGYSGGPILVDGAVVGHLRRAEISTLVAAVGRQLGVNGGQTKAAQAGTLYGCPIEQVYRQNEDLLPLLDPTWGLPDLPKGDLPNPPFLGLRAFEREHAEVFFGRGAELRTFLRRLTLPRASPVCLLYGQAGVGKSSFLGAGLMPRLEASHISRYVRRGSNLRASLEQALGHAGSDDELRAAWHDIEKNRPLIVIVDQVEEAITVGDGAREIFEFFGTVMAIFGSIAARPKGQLVVAYRKEWHAEIREAVRIHRLPHDTFFLQTIDRAGVCEAVTGIESSPHLSSHYRTTVEEGLPGAIASALLQDATAPVAPTLQTILTAMWEEVESKNERVLGVAAYAALRERQYGLREFLLNQLHRSEVTAVPGWQAALDSGLIHDLLYAHTTDDATSGQLTWARRRELYGDSGHIDRFTDVLKNERVRILTDVPSSDVGAASPPSSRAANVPGATRLIHDALAPIVRQEYRRSERFGQRARRLIENRMLERATESLASFDHLEIETIVKGREGMRKLEDAELKFIFKSAVLNSSPDVKTCASWIDPGSVRSIVGELLESPLSLERMSAYAACRDNPFPVFARNLLLAALTEDEFVWDAAAQALGALFRSHADDPDVRDAIAELSSAFLERRYSDKHSDLLAKLAADEALPPGMPAVVRQIALRTAQIRLLHAKADALAQASDHARRRGIRFMLAWCTAIGIPVTVAFVFCLSELLHIWGPQLTNLAVFLVWAMMASTFLAPQAGKDVASAAFTHPDRGSARALFQLRFVPLFVGFFMPYAWAIHDGYLFARDGENVGLMTAAKDAIAAFGSSIVAFATLWACVFLAERSRVDWVQPARRWRFALLASVGLPALTMAFAARVLCRPDSTGDELLTNYVGLVVFLGGVVGTTLLACSRTWETRASRRERWWGRWSFAAALFLAASVGLALFRSELLPWTAPTISLAHAAPLRHERRTPLKSYYRLVPDGDPVLFLGSPSFARQCLVGKAPLALRLAPRGSPLDPSSQFPPGARGFGLYIVHGLEGKRAAVMVDCGVPGVPPLPWGLMELPVIEWSPNTVSLPGPAAIAFPAGPNASAGTRSLRVTFGALPGKPTWALVVLLDHSGTVRMQADNPDFTSNGVADAGNFTAVDAPAVDASAVDTRLFDPDVYPCPPDHSGTCTVQVEYNPSEAQGAYVIVAHDIVEPEEIF